MVIVVGGFRPNALDGTLGNIVVYSIDVKVKEAVLTTFGEKLVLGTVWSKNIFGTVGAANTGEALRNSESDAVDEFVNDWLTVNPKTR